jgi:UDP-N-acetylglucosamine--N-acetylmuramyl-(pentapeptide) pyrophosphoryl-undecaprenol N-acetylglucosamine transferase
MKSSKKKVIFTGGNTGGHVIPAIPIIERFLAEGWEVSYIGTSTGVEKRVCATLKIKFRSIPAGKWRRYFDLRNLTDIVRTGLGFIKSFLILLFNRPTAVFAKGGFVSVPVVTAAKMLRIPCFVHESDATPSLTTRIALKLGLPVLCGSHKCAQSLGAKRATYVGIPVRKNLSTGSREKGLSMMEIHSAKPLLLIFCGSTGATRISSKIREALPKILGNFAVYHICGKGNADASKNSSEYREIEECYEGFENILAASDMVMTRAGATTLAELALLNKPAVIIPLGKRASRGEQLANALEFGERFGGVVLPEEEFEKADLAARLLEAYKSFAPKPASAAAAAKPEDLIFDCISGASRS